LFDSGVTSKKISPKLYSGASAKEWKTVFAGFCHSLSLESE
jgi:hypothetical protein